MYGVLPLALSGCDNEVAAFSHHCTQARLCILLICRHIVCVLILLICSCVHTCTSQMKMYSQGGGFLRSVVVRVYCTLCAPLFSFPWRRADLRTFGEGIGPFGSDCEAFVPPRVWLPFTYSSVEVDTDWSLAVVWWARRGSTIGLAWPCMVYIKGRK